MSKVISVNGQKMYPICKWETNQHKVDTAYTEAINALYDARDSGSDSAMDRAEKQVQKMEIARQWIDNVMSDGIVYAPYEEYKLLKDVIGAYDIRHHI